MGHYLKTANPIEIKGPYYHPVLVDINFEQLIKDELPILCIAAGTGILPFYQILRKYPNANITVAYCTSDGLLKQEMNAYNVHFYSPDQHPLTKDICRIKYNKKSYTYVLVCGSESFTNKLCGYDNDEQYSLNAMYKQENGIPVAIKSKQLTGWLKEIGFKSEQVIVL